MSVIRKGYSRQMLRIGGVLMVVVTLFWQTQISYALGNASSERVTAATITDSLHIGNVVPTWGQQIPKLVYDGKWYYAASLDGEMYNYPWDGKIFKSPDGVNWSLAAQFNNQTTYQPPGLLLDYKGDLHMQVGCYGYADKPCFPGFQTNGTGAVSYHHVVFNNRLADGSFDFSTFADHSVMNSPFYYMGTAVDKTGRYIYTAYADDVWDLHLAVFDVKKNDYIVQKVIVTPPSNRAWLYPKVQPGNKPGEVSILTGQYVLGSPNSAVYDDVFYLNSTDFGQTWSSPQLVTHVDNPNGYERWVDATDLAIDAHGQIHMLYFEKSDGNPDNELWYKEGINGSPVGLGKLDNHAQLKIAPNGERFIFTSEGAGLAVYRSTDGVQWSKEYYPVDHVQSIFWPTLVEKSNGSKTKPHEVKMIVAGQVSGSNAFSHLLMLTYSWSPNQQGNNEAE
ncbi:hypothetical protein ACFPYJ_15825 [Paenibacillus solisilvae]|uniref:Exo-alpha-sialidase n=1 Tax=Paenibacillus solisilvae TaxID=2486751 RepID=A0ABW0W2B7_9BACL